MLFSAFAMAACSGSTSDDLLKVVYGSEGNASNNDKPMTITIYTIKDPATTDDAVKEVEAALSEISEKKYNTKIDLVLLPEEIYASVIFNKLETSINAYHQWVSLHEKPMTYEEQELNKNPEFQNNYPNIKIGDKGASSESQNANIDIFLVYNPKADSPTLDPESEYYNPVLANNGMFDVLYNCRALAELDADKKITNGTFSLLKSIAPTRAMDFVTRVGYKGVIAGDTEKTNSNKQIFGIPNNYVYGSYDFVMFNVNATVKKDGKDVLGGINLFDVRYKEGEKGLTELANNTAYRQRAIDWLEKQVSDALVERGNVGKINPNWSDEEKAEWLEHYHIACQDTLGVYEIEKTFKSYEEYESYITEGKTFAVGYITGEGSLEELFGSSGQLDVYRTGVNYVGDDFVTESMFCVNLGANMYLNEYGTSTVDKTRITRCLEILMLINNNVEFRNILQYGVKDTHYSMNLNGTVSVTGTEDNKYIMTPEWTGNMYILSVSDSMSKAMQKMAESNWYLAKLQSNETMEKKNTGK